MDNTEKIKSLIADGDIQAALELLLSVSKGELKEEAVLLSSRLERIRKKEILDTLSPEEIRREYHRINEAILEIANKASHSNPIINRWHQYRKLIRAVLILAFGFIMIALTLIPKKGFDVNMSIVCDRVSFRYLNGGDLVGQQQLREMKVQNFKEVTLQADSLRLDGEGDGIWFEKEVKTKESLITLRPLPDIGGSEASAAPVSLSSLNHSKDALLTLSLTEDKPDELQIFIQQSERISAEFYFQDSITFFASYVEVTGWDYENELDDLAGKVYCPTSRKVFVEGMPDATMFFLSFQDSLNITSRDLKVTDLDFTKKDGERQVSSLLNADIQFINNDQEPYKTIHLNSNENLFFSAVEDLSLTQLIIQEKGIQLILQGKLKKLQTGPDLKLRNPSYAVWLWHNYQVAIYITAVLMVLIIYIFERKVRKP